MPVDNLIDQLKRDEGCRLKAYKCTAGVWTIGYGHTGDVKEGDTITQHQADQLLLFDIDKHKKELDKALPWAHTLDNARYGVLLNMAFNLGIRGLLGFKNTLRMIKEGKYQEAAKNMLLSKWASQVGNRARRLSIQMASGEWQ